MHSHFTVFMLILASSIPAQGMAMGGFGNATHEKRVSASLLPLSFYSGPGSQDTSRGLGLTLEGTIGPHLSELAGYEFGLATSFHYFGAQNFLNGSIVKLGGIARVTFFCIAPELEAGVKYSNIQNTVGTAPYMGAGVAFKLPSKDLFPSTSEALIYSIRVGGSILADHWEMTKTATQTEIGFGVTYILEAIEVRQPKDRD